MSIISLVVSLSSSRTVASAKKGNKRRVLTKNKKAFAKGFPNQRKCSIASGVFLTNLTHWKDPIRSIVIE